MKAILSAQQSIGHAMAKLSRTAFDLDSFVIIDKMTSCFVELDLRQFPIEEIGHASEVIAGTGMCRCLVIRLCGGTFHPSATDCIGSGGGRINQA